MRPLQVRPFDNKFKTKVIRLLLTFAFHRRCSLGTSVGDSRYLVSSRVNDTIYCSRKAESAKGTDEDDGNPGK